MVPNALSAFRRYNADDVFSRTTCSHLGVALSNGETRRSRREPGPRFPRHRAPSLRAFIWKTPSGSDWATREFRPRRDSLSGWRRSHRNGEMVDYRRSVQVVVPELNANLISRGPVTSLSESDDDCSNS